MTGDRKKTRWLFFPPLLSLWSSCLFDATGLTGTYGISMELLKLLLELFLKWRVSPSRFFFACINLKKEDCFSCKVIQNSPIAHVPRSINKYDIDIYILWVFADSDLQQLQHYLFSFCRPREKAKIHPSVRKKAFRKTLWSQISDKRGDMGTRGPLTHIHMRFLRNPLDICPSRASKRGAICAALVYCLYPGRMFLPVLSFQPSDGGDTTCRQHLRAVPKRSLYYCVS